VFTQQCFSNFFSMTHFTWRPHLYTDMDANWASSFQFAERFDVLYSTSFKKEFAYSAKLISWSMKGLRLTF
jgi:hypothetical protein